MSQPNIIPPAEVEPGLTSPVEMRDTTRPWLIPDTYHGAVLPYANGDFAWAESQVKRFTKVAKISVLSGRPDQARWARALDIEFSDATVDDAPDYIDARHDFGHRDATMYQSRDLLKPLFSVLGPRRPRLLIATLDNKPWTPQTLAADIAANFGVDLDPKWIWGIQNKTADVAAGIYWDTTQVYGTPDFYDPRYDNDQTF